MLELGLLNDDDVSLVEVWLNKEHVRRWYEIPHMGITIDDWMHEINERNGEYHWLTHLIALWQGRPIGLCQYYKCVDSDEGFGTLPLIGSYGIDYLIGEETHLGKGRGKGIITMLVDKIFSFPDVQRVTADIDRSNKASENALLSCGFTLVDVEEIGDKYNCTYGCPVNADGQGICSKVMMIMFPIMEAVRSGGDLRNIGGDYKYSKDIVCPDGCVMFRLMAKKLGNENFYKGKFFD